MHLLASMFSRGAIRNHFVVPPPPPICGAQALFAPSRGRRASFCPCSAPMRLNLPKNRENFSCAGACRGGRSTRLSFLPFSRFSSAAVAADTSDREGDRTVHLDQQGRHRGAGGHVRRGRIFVGRASYGIRGALGGGT